MWEIQWDQPLKTDGWVSRQIIADNRQRMKWQPSLMKIYRRPRDLLYFTTPATLQSFRVYKTSLNLSRFLLTGITVVGKRALLLPLLHIEKNGQAKRLSDRPLTPHVLGPTPTVQNFQHEKTTHHSDSVYGMYFEGIVLRLNHVPSGICNKHAFIFLSCIYL